MSTRIGEWVMVIILCTVSPFASTTRAVEPPRRTQPDMFVNSLGLKMIRIEAEPFDAWAPSFADFQKAVTEVSGGLERSPIPHRVTLPGDYYLGEFPVTNRMYRRFVDETGHRAPSGEVLDLDRIKTGEGFSGLVSVSKGVPAWDREGFAADDQPVAGVNYMDAAAFCAWLSKKEGRGYRLPEVYEWEYACRAGTDTLFWWGDRADVSYMNCAASRVGHPTPVGLYPSNPWGLCDMHGNVSECCEQIGRPGGVLLLTLDMRIGFDSVHDDEGKVMPMQHRGSWLDVFRSEDGGRTWPEKSMLPGYDDGATWKAPEYVFSNGENYPGSIATADGGIITMCPHGGQVQAVHWRPQPRP